MWPCKCNTLGGHFVLIMKVIDIKHAGFAIYERSYVYAGIYIFLNNVVYLITLVHVTCEGVLRP